MFAFDDEEEISYVVSPEEPSLVSETDESNSARTRFMQFLSRRRTPALSDALAVIGLKSALLVGMLSNLGAEEASSPSVAASPFDEVNDADAENEEDEESSNATTIETSKNNPIFASSRSASLMDSPMRSTPPIVRKIRRGTILTQQARTNSRSVSRTGTTSTSSPSSDELPPSSTTTRARSKSVSALHFSSPEASFASQTFNADAPRIRVKDLLKIPLQPENSDQRRKSLATALVEKSSKNSPRKNPQFSLGCNNYNRSVSGTNESFDETKKGDTKSVSKSASIRRRHSAAPGRCSTSDSSEASRRASSYMVESNSLAARRSRPKPRRVMFSEQSSSDTLQVPTFKIWQQQVNLAANPSSSSLPSSALLYKKNVANSSNRVFDKRVFKSNDKSKISQQNVSVRGLRRQKHVDRTHSDEDANTTVTSSARAMRQAFCSSCALSLSRLGEQNSDSDLAPTVVTLDSVSIAARRTSLANNNGAAKVTDV